MLLKQSDKLIIKTCFAFAALSGIFISSALANDPDLNCENLKEFTIGPDGGSFTYQHATVSAAKGVLSKATKFTAEVCPGAEKLESMSLKFPLYKKAEDGKMGEFDHYELLPHSENHSVLRIKAPEGLAINDDQWMSYCMKGSSADPADEYIITHNGKVAPVALDVEPNESEQCVGFRSLSIWGTIKHLPGKGLSAAEKAAKEAHKLEKKVAHESTKIGKGVAKAGEKGFDYLKNLVVPCHACEAALRAGIKQFACRVAARNAAKELEKCSAEVAEELAETAPEISEYSPAMCAGLEAAVKGACKLADDKNKIVKKEEHKIVSKACHYAHLCH